MLYSVLEYWVLAYIWVRFMYNLLQIFLNSEFKIAKIIAQNKKEIYKIINP